MNYETTLRRIVSEETTSLPQTDVVSFTPFSNILPALFHVTIIIVLLLFVSIRRKFTPNFSNWQLFQLLKWNGFVCPSLFVVKRFKPDSRYPWSCFDYCSTEISLACIETEYQLSCLHIIFCRTNHLDKLKLPQPLRGSPLNVISLIAFPSSLPAFLTIAHLNKFITYKYILLFKYAFCSKFLVQLRGARLIIIRSDLNICDSTQVLHESAQF